MKDETVRTCTKRTEEENNEVTHRHWGKVRHSRQITGVGIFSRESSGPLYVVYPGTDEHYMQMGEDRMDLPSDDGSLLREQNGKTLWPRTFLTSHDEPLALGSRDADNGDWELTVCRDDDEPMLSISASENSGIELQMAGIVCKRYKNAIQLYFTSEKETSSAWCSLEIKDLQPGSFRTFDEQCQKTSEVIASNGSISVQAKGPQYRTFYRQ